MQRIKEVKERKEFLEDVGAIALVIFTYAVAGFMAGVGAAISLALIFA